MRTRRATTLEYALLGLLHQEAQSGYGLRKQFAATPLRYFSDSPGAIYPALRRLVARGWVVAGAPQGGRRRQEFRLGGRGRAAFVAWLRQPVTDADVVYGVEELMLRFAFMDQVLPRAAIRSFLVEYGRRMTSQLEALRRFHGRHARALPLTGRLAFEHGLAQCEAETEWVRSAVRALAGTTEGGRGGSHGKQVTAPRVPRKEDQT